EMSVSDTGVGISSANLEHIFEPFFTTKPRGKGNGMGLAAVYGAVQQNRGSINVISKPGNGTTFTVHFPKARYVPDRSSVNGTTPNDKGTCNGSETILLVEDNDDLRMLLATILDARGYQVLQAENGKAALDVYKRESDLIDLVISDVVMP